MKKPFQLLLFVFLFTSCTSNGRLKELLATERIGVQDSVLQIMATSDYDPNLYYQSDYNGRSSFLSWAIERPQIFQQLLEKGANPNQPINDRGSSILNSIFLTKNQTLLMLNYGLQLPGKSPLSGAILLKEKWSIKELKLLKKHGLDLSSKSPKRQTILMRRWGFRTQEELSFISQSIDINAADNQGLTALMHAVKNNHQTYVRLLLRAKASTHIQDKNNKTALDYAKSNSMINLLKQFQQISTPVDN